MSNLSPERGLPVHRENTGNFENVGAPARSGYRKNAGSKQLSGPIPYSINREHFALEQGTSWDRPEASISDRLVLDLSSGLVYIVLGAAPHWGILWSTQHLQARGRDARQAAVPGDLGRAAL